MKDRLFRNILMILIGFLAYHLISCKSEPKEEPLPMVLQPGKVQMDLDSTYFVNVQDRVIHWDTVTTDTLKVGVSVKEIAGYANATIFCEKPEGSNWVVFMDMPVTHSDGTRRYWLYNWSIPKGTPYRVRVKTSGTQLIKVGIE